MKGRPLRGGDCARRAAAYGRLGHLASMKGRPLRGSDDRAGDQPATGEDEPR